MDGSNTRFAVRGALGFGLSPLVVFGVSAAYALVTGHDQTNYFLVVGPICGLVGGLAYGRGWFLSVVLAINCGLVGLLFGLQDARSPLPSDVVRTGLASGFLFWVVGACATLSLPAGLRFDGARTFAVPGAIAGMAFQFLYGPAHFVLDLGSRPWWNKFPWEHLILWMIAGTGAGWLFGNEFDRRQQKGEMIEITRRKSPWALASTICGVLGLALTALYFPRYKLPLGLFNSLSPATAASDWLWSWGLITVLGGAIGIVQTLRKSSRQSGRTWAIAGTIVAIIFFFMSDRMAANPWKFRFNTNYAAGLLKNSDDHAGAVYTANLILAQTALENTDIANAKRYLLEAGLAGRVRNIETTGPDTSIANALLRLGERETVLEYLRRSHNVWPRGIVAIDRWEQAIRANRRPNFNNRSIE